MISIRYSFYLLCKCIRSSSPNPPNVIELNVLKVYKYNFNSTKSYITCVRMLEAEFSL